MSLLLQIALGGALGAVLRAACISAVTRAGGAGFPFGTLSVNVLGSFAMGLGAMLLLERGGTPMARFAPFLLPGLLGGFTTFSAFSLDAYRLLEEGRGGAALAYVAGSVGLGLAALLAGIGLARLWAAS